MESLQSVLDLKHLPRISLIKSTGLIKVQSPLLKTKGSAVHAGLSPLLALSRAPISTEIASFFPSLNNNLLTAQNPTETTAAMVASWIFPSSISKTMELLLKTNIPIMELAALANTTKILTRSGPSVTALKSQSIMSKLLWLLLPWILFPLLSKPTIFPSNFTRVEFILETAEPTLTTESWLLVMELRMERNTTEWRTLGALVGEWKDTYLSKGMEMERENVVSRWLLLTPSHDLIHINISNSSYYN